MIFVRWSAERRALPTAEVDGFFRAMTDQVLLFAFDTNRMEVESHGGHLSLKMVAHGEEVYHLNGRTIPIEPGHVLLMNAGERYASAIERPRTRSISFFLPAGEVAAARAAATASDSSLLDDPTAAHVITEVSQAPFRAAGPLAALASCLTTAAFVWTNPDACALEELVVQTAVAALQADLRLVRRGALDSCARKSTRAELIARVVRARELIEDRGGRVSLSEMASVACLSRYHFVRVFRDATGLTPAAYARRVRLERGLADLQRTGSRRRGARTAGFASVSTFLRATRRARRD